MTENLFEKCEENLFGSKIELEQIAKEAKKNNGMTEYLSQCCNSPIIYFPNVLPYCSNCGRRDYRC